MIQEFKAFIMRGNVLELAVAVIIAGAFGAVITSFTNDIIMPPIGMLLGGVDFSNLAIVLKPAEMNEAGEVLREAVTIGYGAWINTIISFLIVAFSVFMVIKAYNKINPPKPPVVTPAGPTQEELLIQIRDLLKK